MNYRLPLALALSFAVMPLAIAAGSPADIPVKDFFRHAEFGQVTLSPTGEFLAVTIPQDDRSLLAILRTKDKGVVAKWDYGTSEYAENVIWVNDKRFMVEVSEKFGTLDFHVGNPNLYLADADGSHRKEVPYGNTYELADLLPNDPDNILMERSFERPNLFKMNVNTGYMAKVVVSPVASGNFAIDHDGKVRYAMGATEAGDLFRTFRRDGDQWVQVSEKKMYGSDDDERVPLGFAPDNKHIYMSFRSKGGPAGVLLSDPDTNTEKVLFQNPVVSFGDQIWNHDNVRMLGVGYEEDLPKHQYFDEDAPETRILMALDSAFPDDAVDVTSETRDGRYALVHTHSATDPGRFYLFDTQTKQATFLLAGRSWIDPDQMSPMKPITVTARDGLVLHGYLTVPRSSNGRNMPMVVWVHGGPMARDDWAFDPIVQFLASRGYAVLQMNYRGSSGYGEKFMEMGYKHWGTTMQDDLTDSVKSVISQGLVDKDRVCIFGASYGGYAAIMSAEREPDLYKCTIGYAGVYSLPMEVQKSDTGTIKSGRTSFKNAYPESLAEQQAQSPSYNVDKLKIPVMLVHGGDDQRVPIAQMHFLVDQMAKAGKKPEVVLVKQKEAHGFRDPENNIELYTKVQAFLNEHIGAGANDAGKSGGAP